MRDIPWRLRPFAIAGFLLGNLGYWTARALLAIKERLTQGDSR